jgi:large subunit ribosomal protein L29
MPLSKMSEIRDLSDSALEDKIVALKRQLFELRMQKATRRLEKPHLFRHTRHQLSQLLTLERRRSTPPVFHNIG